ncbi:MAG: response regulator [Spirochaetaceae bacterium]|nr:response regulator [Spirochaetaceae bacterium]
MGNTVILIVEDEPLLGKSLQGNLEDSGFTVPDVITNSENIMPAIVKHKPDLIILDINLHSFNDGITAAQRVRLLGDTPIIYITASRDEETKKLAMTTNPVDYLLKPFRSETLLKAVNKALSR